MNTFLANWHMYLNVSPLYDGLHQKWDIESIAKAKLMALLPININWAKIDMLSIIIVVWQIMLQIDTIYDIKH